MKFALNSCVKCKPTFITVSCALPIVISTKLIQIVYDEVLRIIRGLSLTTLTTLTTDLKPQHFAHLVCDGLEVPFILQVMTSADPLLEFHLFAHRKNIEKNMKQKSNNLSVRSLSNQSLNIFLLYILLSNNSNTLSNQLSLDVSHCFPISSVRLLCVRKGTDGLFGKVMPGPATLGSRIIPQC